MLPQPCAYVAELRRKGEGQRVLQTNDQQAALNFAGDLDPLGDPYHFIVRQGDRIIYQATNMRGAFVCDG